MSKKKKAKKKLSLLKELDLGLNGTFDTVQEEIENYSRQIALVDREVEKRERRKQRRDPSYVYNDKKKITIRNEILKRMESSSFYERCTEMLKKIGPAIVMLARIIAAFICLILQVKPVQRILIDKGWDTKIKTLYNTCMSITI